MKREEFLHQYVRGKKTTQSCVSVVKFPKVKYSYFQIELKESYECLKGLFKNINFECNIDKQTGGCKETPLAKKCCCHDCVNNIGYIHLMFEKDITYYSRLFSSKTGFWRKGKGCILPHHRRSVICLTHHCNHRDEGYQHFSKGIFQVKRRLQDLRDKIIDNTQRGVFN